PAVRVPERDDAARTEDPGARRAARSRCAAAADRRIPGIEAAHPVQPGRDLPEISGARRPGAAEIAPTLTLRSRPRSGPERTSRRDRTPPSARASPVPRPPHSRPAQLPPAPPPAFPPRGARGPTNARRPVSADGGGAPTRGATRPGQDPRARTPPLAPGARVRTAMPRPRPAACAAWSPRPPSPG